MDRVSRGVARVTILVFLAALVQRTGIHPARHGQIGVTILVFLAALVQPKWRGQGKQAVRRALQSLFFWQL